MIILYFLKNDLYSLDFFIKQISKLDNIVCYIISNIKNIESLPQNFNLVSTIPKLELTKKYLIFSDDLFGPVNDEFLFVKLKNKNYISSKLIHFYMFYYNEPVYEEYGNFYNCINFIKLEPQTINFESEGFLKITEIPDKKYIGILTPSITKKTGLKINDILEKIEYYDCDIISLYYSGENVINQAKKTHGDNFVRLWNWLLTELNIPIEIEIPSFFSNLWIIKKEYFLEYLIFIKKVKDILDNSPEDIQILLKNDSLYNGNITPYNLLIQTGYSYYTYYPFILERIICLFVKINNLTIKKLK
jgi:hypothetical protein